MFHDIFWALALLTMVVGNVIAIVQTNIKRMLAYSSIAHAGYILVGLLAANSEYARLHPELNIPAQAYAGILFLCAGVHLYEPRRVWRLDPAGPARL